MRILFALCVFACVFWICIMCIFASLRCGWLRQWSLSASHPLKDATKCPTMWTTCPATWIPTTLHSCTWNECVIKIVSYESQSVIKCHMCHMSYKDCMCYLCYICYICYVLRVIHIVFSIHFKLHRQYGGQPAIAPLLYDSAGVGSGNAHFLNHGTERSSTWPATFLLLSLFFICIVKYMFCCIPLVFSITIQI